MLECITGFILFSRIRLEDYDEPFKENLRVSIIIPARNEEKNLPYILGSLESQTYMPYEVIVVDDFSSDRTKEIAGQYGVTVIENTALPEGWTGKTWAVWNGFLKSSGDILVFLDADIRLAPNALKALIKTREKRGGAISVVPYHYTERFYERLSLVPYLLGVFAFTSPFERKNPKKGLYGSCIVALREDYEKIKGHEGIKEELLDDLNLGKKFLEYGVSVDNFIGSSLVSFRMYPNGIGGEMQGFGKGAVLSTAALMPLTIIFIAIWIFGLFTAGLITPILIFLNHEWLLPFLIGYFIYAVQIMYFLKYTGRYGRIIPALHFLSSLFFILVLIYSIYQVKILGRVSWKGREIRVGGRKRK